MAQIAALGKTNTLVFVHDLLNINCYGMRNCSVLGNNMSCCEK